MSAYPIYVSRLRYTGPGTRQAFEETLVEKYQTTIGRIVTLQELLAHVGPDTVRAMDDQQIAALLADFIGKPAKYGQNMGAVLGFTASFIDAGRNQRPAPTRANQDGERAIAFPLGHQFSELAKYFDLA